MWRSPALAADVPLLELTPGDDPHYAHELGGKSDVFLVRPDGYIGMAASASTAARALDSYAGRWLRVGGDPA